MSSPSPILSRLIESISVSREWEGKRSVKAQSNNNNSSETEVIVETEGFVITESAEEDVHKCKAKREELCTCGRGGRKKGKEGRRRHVGRSMIYRLHCRHGDFCQPSLRSKVGVQNGGATVWWWVGILAGGGVERAEEGLRGC